VASETSPTTGPEDTEKVIVALLAAVGAAETGRETLVFLTRDAVRLATAGVATGVACDGCPSKQELMERFRAAGGLLIVCPICFNSRNLQESTLVENARLGGTIPLWEWIGDGATTFRC
jgi:predicted peroxiredoxin